MFILSPTRFLVLFTILCIVGKGSRAIGKKSSAKKTAVTEFVQEKSLLFISTLDGSLVAVEQRTGDVRWKLSDEPVVKVPVDPTSSISPLFLPDPKDGSLYMLGGTSGFDALKKLPFTIPQLVASSPCRSTDGILYTGRKADSWIAVDADTGRRQQVLSFDRIDFNVCPVGTSQTIFIGRTEYSIMMFDSNRKERRWNVTFFEYSANPMDSEALKKYDLAHFATVSQGRVVTRDRYTGGLLWELDVGSPAVAMYQLQGDAMVAVPFTSVAADTLSSLQSSIAGPDTKLFLTLYVGQYNHGFYALPSLADSSTATIMSPQHPLLLEGPKNKTSAKNEKFDIEQNFPTATPLSSLKSNTMDLLLGHYQIPEYSNTRLQIAGKSNPTLPDVIEIPSASPRETASVQTQTDSILNLEWITLWDQLKSGDLSLLFSSNFIQKLVLTAKFNIMQQENKLLKLTIIIIFTIIFLMFWYLYTRMKEIQRLTSQSSHGSNSSYHSDIDFDPMDESGVDEQVVKVGKIELLPHRVLGRGCEGTFVFHGRFEGRPVAVKRLLPECFTVADREVELLRESDEHPNVVRYFCTEKDRQFRYIALELCAATLEDYVLGRFKTQEISLTDVLAQATSGLNHLHSLDIVHRDIKPHNVLLSQPNPRGEIRAMISDFGLCKKLQVGRLSFSHRSGVAGTDGWIAPEMINPEISATCAVDIFSLGCVFYFVLSNGKHPFGSTLCRQANILNGVTNLDELKGKYDALSLGLVEAMISPQPKDRPPATAILNHPFFWDAPRILTFFQDVSDRVETEEMTSSVMMALERRGWSVVQRDWRKHVDEEVAADLRKYRSYRGHSVRDLLRALRNKKHHYRELSSEARQSLGQVPHQFTKYWTSRFPLLLIHTWHAMQCVYLENSMQEYYHPEYLFPQNIHALKHMKDFLDEDNIAEREKLSDLSPAQKDLSKVWTGNGSSKKSQQRQRKPQSNPVWRMNWRDPTPPLSKTSGIEHKQINE